MKLPKELRDKRDLGGTAKTKKCSVEECSENAIRSLSENAWKKYIEKAGLKLKDSAVRRLYLCKPHYSQSNKIRKSQEKIFQKKGFLNDKNSRKKGKWEIS
ncbi:MAG: hypothetical protein ACXAC5_07105 [Promethearchaeota archaeon]|jgi:hypothetical protein